jgi:hypothetical protein
VQFNLSSTLTVGGIPLLLVLFPMLIVLCIVLSIDVLRHPGPAERVISERARRRSRPWLLTTAGVLLLVSLLVTAFIGYVVSSAAEGKLDSIGILSIGLFDLFLSLMISFASMVLGQAIVSYEVFTGKVLPRRSLARHWRSIVIISLASSVAVGWSLTVQLRPVYSLLLTMLVMVAFYALYTWRSFVDREQSMRRLRPFVSSQQLMTHLFNPDSDTTTRAAEFFRAVCQDVLGTQQAQLLPSPALATLVGQGLIYPTGLAAHDICLSPDLNTGITALDPDQHGGFQWAIPLWAERGLIGTLLIGEKEDSGLYTQEEIEIAQASGERIVDMLASEQVARRLMELERARWREHRVMELQTRRTLHDDILPVLHTLVLQLHTRSDTDSGLQDAIASLSDIHRQISSLIHSMQNTPDAVEYETDLVAALQKIVNVEFASEFESVTWQIADILPMDAQIGDVVVGAGREVIRNAAVHGRGDQPNRALHLRITVRCTHAIQIIIEDDGVGVAATPSDTTPVGSGGGLVLHGTLLAVLGGILMVEPGGEGGTKVTISVPGSLVPNLGSR